MFSIFPTLLFHIFWLYSLDNKNVSLGPRKDIAKGPPKKDSCHVTVDQVEERTRADLKGLCCEKEMGKIFLM